jgi:hypothetical protein
MIWIKGGSVLDSEAIKGLMTKAHGVCEYNDEAHEYRVGGVVVPSITQRKGEIAPAFDGEAIAKKMANKTGSPVDYIQASWKAVGDCGTMVHELIESCISNGHVNRPTNHYQYGALAHERFFEYRKLGIPEMMVREFRKKHLIPIACELTVWCKDAGGTVDLLAYDQEKDCYIIVDWKTNAKQFHTTHTRYDVPLGGPFSRWYSTHLNQYSFQLECYAAMLEAVGLRCGKGVIVHGYFDFFGAACDVHHTDTEMRQACKTFLGLS